MTNKEKLVEDTWLTSREVELYILHKEQGMSIREAAEEMGISRGNASGKLGSIKEKAAKSEKTANLLDF